MRESSFRVPFLLLFVLAAVAGPVLASDSAAPRVRLYAASAEGQPLPLQIDLPFLRSTRWDLRGLPLGERIEERLAATGGGVSVERYRLDLRIEQQSTLEETLLLRSETPLPTTYLGQPALPEESPDLGRLGSRARLDYTRAGAPVTVLSETLARGWLYTHAGPFIVSLRREEVYRGDPAGSKPSEVRLRWVSARVGTVALATIVGGASASLASGHAPEVGRDQVDSLTVLSSRPSESLAEPRAYWREMHGGPFEVHTIGLDTGDGTTIDSLVPETVSTMADLMALDVWDFSGNTSGVPKITTVVCPPENADCLAEHCPAPTLCDETCNAAQCGYRNTSKAETMTRVDRDPEGGSSWRLTNSIFWNDGDDGPGGTPLDPEKVTVWLIAGAQNEGISDFFGSSGEGRFCYDTDEGRIAVPNSQYQHRDAAGNFYAAPGDTWSSEVFDCEQNVNDTTCGVDDAIIGDGRLWTGRCQAGSQWFEGTQSGRMMPDAGTIVLPSGHTFNTVLQRTDVSFCNYLFESSCGQSGAEQVQKYVTLFNAPHLGSLARLDSPQTVPEEQVPDLYTTLQETQIGVGLYPPVSIQVDAALDGSVQLSWNPGDETYIDRYKVYWGPASGFYDSNSDDDPSQITGDLSVGNHSVTVTGLTNGVSYYFTVSALRSYANPGPGGSDPSVKNSSFEYESPLFPVLGTVDPDFDYPSEVGAVPGAGCFPTAEVRGLSLSETGTDIEFCWEAAEDSCLSGYELLGSDDATGDAGWGPAADPGAATCWTGNPDSEYYLVVGDGPGGQGPWGHYGR